MLPTTVGINEREHLAFMLTLSQILPHFLPALDAANVVSRTRLLEMTFSDCVNENLTTETSCTSKPLIILSSNQQTDKPGGKQQAVMFWPAHISDIDVHVLKTF